MSTIDSCSSDLKRPHPTSWRWWSLRLLPYWVVTVPSNSMSSTPSTVLSASTSCVATVPSAMSFVALRKRKRSVRPVRHSEKTRQDEGGGAYEKPLIVDVYLLVTVHPFSSAFLAALRPKISSPSQCWLVVAAEVSYASTCSAVEDLARLTWITRLNPAPRGSRERTQGLAPYTYNDGRHFGVSDRSGYADS